MKIEPSSPSAGSGVGAEIMDAVIHGGLLHGICAHKEEHGVVIVWSSGAEEQLEALVATRVHAISQKWESDCRMMNGYAQLLTEAGISPTGPELVEAVKRWESLQNDRTERSAGNAGRSQPKESNDH